MREGAPVNKRSWKSKYIQKKKKTTKKGSQIEELFSIQYFPILQSIIRGQRKPKTYS